LSRLDDNHLEYLVQLLFGRKIPAAPCVGHGRRSFKTNVRGRVAPLQRRARRSAL